MLYIANFSRHNLDFFFHPLGYVIPPNGQIGIDGDPTWLDRLLAHHTIYGIVPASSIPAAGPFAGIAFRQGEPIDMAKIAAPDVMTPIQPLVVLTPRDEYARQPQTQEAEHAV